jgi:hypothetical protein
LFAGSDATISQEALLYIEHVEKIPKCILRCLISMNILPRKEEGYYAYSLQVGGKLFLLISVRSHHSEGVGERAFPLLCTLVYVCLGS